MQSTIRTFAAILMTFLTCASASADTYPTRPIRWIVPYAAGGGNDVLSRTVGQFLSSYLGQPVVIENKPGAASAIAAAEVARAPADGYTVFSADNGTLVYNPLLSRKISYDPVRDFDPIALVARVPTIFVAGPSAKAADLKEFLSLVRSEPNNLNYASSGTGSPHDMAMELMKLRAGLKMNQIPYRGGALAMQDVVAGQVPFTMTDTAGGAAMLRAGKVRPLAVANRSRLTNYPDVPTFAEAGVQGVEADAFVGLVVPKGTPVAIISRLQDGINAALKSPEVLARFETLGFEPVGGTTQRFGEHLAAEIARWRPVVEELKLSTD